MSQILLNTLIEAFSALPGIGPKSAQRIAYHLLQRNRKAGLQLSEALHLAMTKVGHCNSCRNFSENDFCNICSNSKRVNAKQLCIIESPENIAAIEQTGLFSGTYFVLMGLLSPIAGIGPRELGLDLLQKRLNNENFSEIIIALTPSAEGEVTASYIAQLAKPFNIKVTKIAQGIPTGSSLDMVDGTTISHALIGRHNL